MQLDLRSSLKLPSLQDIESGWEEGLNLDFASDLPLSCPAFSASCFAAEIGSSD